MRQPKGTTEYGKEGCCPHEFDHVPAMTGCPETDLSIMRCKNPDASARLANHLKGGAYEVQNGYNAYSANID